MKVLFILIVVSLIVALGFLAAFLWAMRTGQYEDDVTPSIRMLNELPKQRLKNQNNEA